MEARVHADRNNVETIAFVFLGDGGMGTGRARYSTDIYGDGVRHPNLGNQRYRPLHRSDEWACSG